MQTISCYWEKIQGTLFPILEQELPPLTQKQQQLASILEILRIEEFIFPNCPGFRGRPEKSRRAILRAFVAKSVYNMPTTRMLIERLYSDISLRRICGFELRNEIPSESAFSRAFADFAATELLTQVHAELIKTHYLKGKAYCFIFASPSKGEGVITINLLSPSNARVAALSR